MLLSQNLSVCSWKKNILLAALWLFDIISVIYLKCIPDFDIVASKSQISCICTCYPWLGTVFWYCVHILDLNKVLEELSIPVMAHQMVQLNLLYVLPAHVSSLGRPLRLQNWSETTTKTNWAAIWQNQQNGCASREDSDHPGHPPSLISLRCPHEENLGP